MILQTRVDTRRTDRCRKGQKRVGEKKQAFYILQKAYRERIIGSVRWNSHGE